MINLQYNIGILGACLPFLCAVAVPVFNVVKGGNALKAFFWAWGFIVVSFLCFTSVIPIIVHQFDKKLSHEIASFFPQPAIAFAMIFFGWFYAAVPILLGIGFRKIMLGFRKIMLRKKGDNFNT